MLYSSVATEGANGTDLAFVIWERFFYEALLPASGPMMKPMYAPLSMILKSAQSGVRALMHSRICSDLAGVSSIPRGMMTHFSVCRKSPDFLAKPLNAFRYLTRCKSSGMNAPMSSAKALEMEFSTRISRSLRKGSTARGGTSLYHS